MSDKKITVLGGGLAGLAFAWEADKKGFPTEIHEADRHIGGLARTVGKNGYAFDLGGHRFFTDKEWIVDWVRDLLGDRLLEVPRKSRIYMAGRFFDYPLRPGNALWSMGAAMALKILAGYAISALRFPFKRLPDDSFEGWIINRFGRGLYEIYFEPYTEKVWGIPCSEISAEWAVQRISLMSLTDAVIKAVFQSEEGPKTYASRFYYPKGGVCGIPDELARRLSDAGHRIVTESRATRIVHRSGRVEAVQFGDGEETAVESVVSTIPVTDLVRMMDPPPPPEVMQAASMLSYRSIVCVFLLLDKPEVTDDTWIYFPDKETLFGRLHEPRNWDRSMVPEGKTSVCLEIFCNEGDDAWSMSDRDLLERCMEPLHRLGFVSREEVVDFFTERVPNAYPVFTVGYEENLERVFSFTGGIGNLELLGRTGAYLYHNMDQVIEDAIAKAEQIAAKW